MIAGVPNGARGHMPPAVMFPAGAPPTPPTMHCRCTCVRWCFADRGERGRGRAPRSDACSHKVSLHMRSCALLHAGTTRALLHAGTTRALLHAGTTRALLHAGTTRALLHAGATRALLHAGTTRALLHAGTTRALLHAGTTRGMARPALRATGTPVSNIVQGRGNGSGGGG